MENFNKINLKEENDKYWARLVIELMKQQNAAADSITSVKEDLDSQVKDLSMRKQEMIFLASGLNKTEAKLHKIIRSMPEAFVDPKELNDKILTRNQAILRIDKELQDEKDNTNEMRTQMMEIQEIGIA